MSETPKPKSKPEPFTPSVLLKAQDDFFVFLCHLRLRIQDEHPDWLITIAEAGVQRERRGFVKDASGKVSTVPFTFVDAVHMKNSHHYERLAADLNVFVPVEGANSSPRLYRQVTDSDAPEWGYIHQTVHELGIQLGDDLLRTMPSSSADANHVARAVDSADKRI